ncbi:peptidoglycan DD-metalloendopeptidase family protein [Clostridium boliviensis]|uniref:Peptidoglycan DD-metalloendopeptidase family protein n=1 Tax=Clostridium boliviensis TaxID=318465 RepID=A0ABU4GR62_9CLOT|nr:peptidoglycan DD-metalloendopeptidase family protein [Clostridium boliviensis]MDW2799423.1 peptidoglycan DD-metalloendopeptidase family protein [Clostridium boliviensis]
MKHGKRLLAVGIGLFMTVSCIFPSYGTKNEVNDAKKKASSLEDEKKEVESALKELEGLKSDASAYVKGMDDKLADYDKQLTALTAQISAKEEQIKAAKADLEAAREAQEHQYRNMKLRIQYMYEKGETSYLDLLFRSADLTQLFNRAEYIRSITAYDRRMLEDYKRTKEEISQREVLLNAEYEKLLGFQTAAREKKKDAEELLQAKNQELASYQNQIAKNQENLSELEKDLAAQEQRIIEMEALIRKQEEEARKAAQKAGKTYNTVAIGNIKFIWPCPSSARITSSFGDRDSPTEGASSNHQGIDIGASSGNDVLAAASGTVTISTYSYSAGNYIMIHHGGGVYTVYMHCSQLLVSAGQEVSQGQLIGKVGSTGYSTGPHLHFGIRVNGSYVNPVKYVSP